MAQEYILIKEREQETGLIALSKGVFETISEILIEEDEDTVIAEGKTMKKAVQCKVVDNKFSCCVVVCLTLTESG